MNPLVSIYIVTKNRKSLLQRALDSALSQSYQYIEVVVVDDGSEDDTFIYMSDKAESYSNLIYFRFEESHGAPIARNKAIELARGEYVTGLDDDDIFTEDRVKNFVDEIDIDVSFICSRYIYSDEKRDIESIKPAELIDFKKIKKSNVVGNQVFVARESMISLGGFDSKMKSWQDYDMWFRLIKKNGPAKRIEAATYIVDASGDRERITSSSNAHKGYLQFIEKHGAELSESEKEYQRLNDLYNRNEGITLRELLAYVNNKDCFKRALTIYIRCSFPRIYSRVEKIL